MTDGAPRMINAGIRQECAGQPAKVSTIQKNTLAPHRIAELCSQPEPIAKVMALNDLPSKLGTRHFECVYVVSPADLPVAKVGVAVDPMQRLTGLQCGNWNRLYVRSLFWCLSGAYDLERAVHAKAREFDVALVGEWIGLEAEQAALLVAKLAKEVDCSIGDSTCYLDSWLAHAEAHDKHTTERRRKQR